MKTRRRETVEARLHTGSSKRTVELKDAVYHIYTHAKPVDGKANNDAVSLLADYMGVPKRNVTIIKGERSKDKVFEITRGI
ncbi:MAG: DUF167 domain-containing protein [Spirochaetes bacterium]|nr:DUF167 domain-containing protein [Spirochaetota bacterium]